MERGSLEERPNTAARASRARSPPSAPAELKAKVGGQPESNKFDCNREDCPVHANTEHPWQASRPGAEKKRGGEGTGGGSAERRLNVDKRPYVSVPGPSARSIRFIPGAL